MLDNEGAGAGQDDGQDGSGAPSGGSPEGGSENDDKPITAKQLKAALESQKRHYEGQLAGQRAEFESFKQGVGTRREEPPVEKPKRYTRAQLSAAVEARQITQDQADETWAAQIEVDATERAVSAATAAVAGRTQKERIDSDLSKYKRLKPEILVKGSDERLKIETEFRELVSTGMPDNLATELAAIRAVLGPLEKLETASRASRRVEEDQQGGGSEDGKPKGGSSKLVDHLKGEAKEYYAERIKRGLYKDWDAVEKELKYARPGVRQRLGLPQA